MRLTFRMVLMLTCFAFIATPPVIAKDVGKSKTEAKAKSYAITMGTPCENAVFANVFNHVGESLVAPTQMGYCKETPAVEVKAKTTVAASTDSYRYKRGNTTAINLAVASNLGRKFLHIDPGLI